MPMLALNSYSTPTEQLRYPLPQGGTAHSTYSGSAAKPQGQIMKMTVRTSAPGRPAGSKSQHARKKR
jgi:hypothetical protein